MGKGVRVDSVTPVTGGGVSIGITIGNGTYSDAPSKQAFIYASKAAIVDAITDMESRFTDEDLLLLMIATAHKADNQLSLAVLNNMIGKKVKLTLKSGADLVTIA